MKYSKATNYALHTMMHLSNQPAGQTLGVVPLADKQDVSATYLSKILTKLVKANLIESATGVNGGYRLMKRSKEISFLDVINAIEGEMALFSCTADHAELEEDEDCLIDEVMERAEQHMKQYLDQQLIRDVAEKFRVRHSS
ncbi:RrF2 family transcriptional regulator [Planococcus lenghuensis]|uniref:Transcriptional regulator n=1 Tax=Planococcus lenghuensis TaxID=2213202 RepID=A0A1Q2L1S9_9BACL|nr:Rrf2 family transcriptional regulator [Planococcus lenghuensis]AQQ54425.1 transcriptional regulator [Planococcus lenghuensis]